MTEQPDWRTLREATLDKARQDRLEVRVRKAIHLVAAAADAKRYAEWVIYNANLALARLAEDGIYPENTPLAERYNTVREPELNYPFEKVRLALADLDTGHRVTHGHLTDAEMP